MGAVYDINVNGNIDPINTPSLSTHPINTGSMGAVYDINVNGNIDPMQQQIQSRYTQQPPQQQQIPPQQQSMNRQQQQQQQQQQQLQQQPNVMGGNNMMRDLGVNGEIMSNPQHRYPVQQQQQQQQQQQMSRQHQSNNMGGNNMGNNNNAGNGGMMRGGNQDQNMNQRPPEGDLPCLCQIYMTTIYPEISLPSLTPLTIPPTLTHYPPLSLPSPPLPLTHPTPLPSPPLPTVAPPGANLFIYNLPRVSLPSLTTLSHSSHYPPSPLTTLPSPSYCRPPRCQSLHLPSTQRSHRR